MRERGDTKAKKMGMNWKAIYAMLISAHMKFFTIIKYSIQLLKSILQGTRCQDSSVWHKDCQHRVCNLASEVVYFF